MSFTGIVFRSGAFAAIPPPAQISESNRHAIFIGRSIVIAPCLVKLAFIKKMRRVSALTNTLERCRGFELNTRMRILQLLARIIMAAAISFTSPVQAAAGKTLAYIGTYTGGKSKGIYTCELDTATGDLKVIGLAAELESPSFVAIHPK